MAGCLLWQIIFRLNKKVLKEKMHVIYMHIVSFIPEPKNGGQPVPALCRWIFGAVLMPLSFLSLHAQDKAVLYIGWRAEPECGGFFQALNAGIYKKYGLDTKIQLGSPQASATIFLATNKVDFIEGSSGDAINFVRQHVPVVTVAALFQKSPRVLIAHPGQGNDTLEQMKGKPILIGAQALTTAWPFLKSRFGFTDQQIRPYTFNEAPFLANPQAIQEGFLTEEPYTLPKVGVPNPVVFLLSDHGYEEYAMALMTTSDKVKSRSDFVQRFVNASIEGWYSYLYGDPTPGNRYIKENNPAMSDDQIAYSIKKMRESGIVDSGDSKQLGIGAMTDARWQGFFQSLVDAGVEPAGTDIHQAYTLQFVNKKVGM
jgi:NitT/TauT family transport system substrate-binding protein